MATETDPIIEEIHAVRRKIAERFEFDVHRISEDAKIRQLASGRKVVDLAARESTADRPKVE